MVASYADGGVSASTERPSVRSEKFVASATSAARAVNVNRPAAVGVPRMVPESASRASPAGRAPETTVHRYVPLPPDAASDAAYEAERRVDCRLDVWIATAFTGTPTDNVRLRSAKFVTSSASAARATKMKVPPVVGVPEIVPAGASTRPGGNEPDASDHVYDPLPPEACSVAEYGWPVLPFGSADVVIATA